MLILRLPHRQWSLSLVREEEDDEMWLRTSWCPTLGCSTLGAEQEWMEWNVLGSPFSPSRSDLIPNITR
jgi:hypothetical protein